MNPVQTLSCSLVRVVDGDTFVVRVPLYPLLLDVPYAEPKVRLAHVNAPEKTAFGGREATEAVAEFFRREPPFILHTYGRDKYSRLLADVENDSQLLSRIILGMQGSKPMEVARMLVIP